jgi:hypothetical protein
MDQSSSQESSMPVMTLVVSTTMKGLGMVELIMSRNATEPESSAR